MSKNFKISASDAANTLFHLQLSQKPASTLSHTPVPIRTNLQTLQPGEILICYKGINFDPHDHPGEIAAKKPKLVICEKQLPIVADISQITVKSGRLAWAHLSAKAYNHPQHGIKIIGITGTNGKTSTVSLLKQLLSDECASLGTLGGYIGAQKFATTHTTPDPPELFDFFAKCRLQDIKYVAMEVSSHALAQYKVAPLQFACAAFTSFSRDHLDLHGSMNDYWNTKIELFKQVAGTAVINTGLDRFKELTELCKKLGFKTVTYGRQNTAAQYSIDVQGQTAQIVGPTQKDLSFDTSIFGSFALENLLAAALCYQAVTGTFPGPPQLAKLKPPRGRLELVSGQQQPMVFVDYAHTPDAIINAIATLKPICKGNLWIVFGCGGDRDAGKRSLMGSAASQADHIAVTSDNPRFEDPEQIISDILPGITQNKLFSRHPDRGQTIDRVIAHARPDDVVLIAGKGHEAYVEVAGKRTHFDDRERAAAALEKHVRG